MRIINKLILAICAFFVSVALSISFIPKITLSSTVLLGCFILPSLIVFTSMIIQVKNTSIKTEKRKIMFFWLKTLFIIYCLLLLELLFLNNEYRERINAENIFSTEHLNTTNFIPFSTILNYGNRIQDNTITIQIAILNIVTNLILFAPMGFFIPLLFKTKIKNFKQFLFFMLVITTCVELLQFLTLSGCADVDDIILNVIGSCGVYILMNVKFIKKLVKISIAI